MSTTALCQPDHSFSRSLFCALPFLSFLLLLLSCDHSEKEISVQITEIFYE